MIIEKEMPRGLNRNFGVLLIPMVNAAHAHRLHSRLF